MQLLQQKGSSNGIGNVCATHCVADCAAWSSLDTPHNASLWCFTLPSVHDAVLDASAMQ
jgi:hypothetical protein